MRSWFRRQRQGRRSSSSNSSNSNSNGNSAFAASVDRPVVTNEGDPEDYQLVHLGDIEGVKPQVWNPHRHHLYPKKARLAVKAVLLIAGRKATGEPFHPDVPLARLPKEILLRICQFVAGSSGYRFLTQSTKVGPFEFDVSLPIAPSSDPYFQRCDTVVVKFKLGCKRSPPGWLSTGLCCGKYHFCYHPGYHYPSGAFRGPESESGSKISNTGNLNMGWVPAQEELHDWVMIFRRQGQNETSITAADGANRFVHNWDTGSSFIADDGNSMQIASGGCPEVLCSDVRVWFL